METRVSRAVPNTVLRHLGVDSAQKLIWTTECSARGEKYVIVTAKDDERAQNSVKIKS